MKFIHAVLILFFSIIIQVSFIRLFDSFSLAFNLSLVILFYFCYILSFEKILIMAIFAGMAIDLSGSASFGSTSLAMVTVCSLNFYLKENILRDGRLADFFLNSLIYFLAFYFLLAVANIFLNSSFDYAAIAKLININLASEILFNIAVSVCGYYFLKRYKNGKIYGFIGNIKISS